MEAALTQAAPSRTRGHTPTLEEEFEQRIRCFVSAVGDRGHCKTCKAEIYWVRLRTGRIAAYDASGRSHYLMCSPPAPMS